MTNKGGSSLVGHNLCPIMETIAKSCHSQNGVPQFMYAKYKISLQGKIAHGCGLLDTGSNFGLISRACLPDNIVLTPTSNTLSGVGGSLTLQGYIICTVNLSEVMFSNVRFDVVDFWR